MPARRQSHPFRIAVLILFLVIIGAVAVYFFITSRSTDNSQTPIVSKPDKPATPTQADCIMKLPDELKIAQKLMFASYSESILSYKDLLADNTIGGIILMDEVPSTSIAALKTGFKVAPFI